MLIVSFWELDSIVFSFVRFLTLFAGVGQFTIVDGENVTGEDVGNNFFLERGIRSRLLQPQNFIDSNSLKTILFRTHWLQSWPGCHEALAGAQS